MPPSIEEIERRLRKRNTDSEEQIKIRLERLKEDVKLIKNCGLFSEKNYLVNDVLDEAYEKF